MVKLYKIIQENNTHWCFAPDSTTAKNIILNTLSEKKVKLKAKDVTKSMISEDGVQNLINHEFVGIPKRSVFMLNGSVLHKNEHFKEKNRSNSLWWSEKIPNSRDAWK